MAYLPQRGLGGYVHSGNWTWEYYPPPYDFLAPANSRPMVAPILYPRGVGGCGCGGGCGGACHSAGLGLFDSGLDLAQWGLGEWAAVGLGVYLIGSLMGDAGRAGRKVRRYRSARHVKRIKERLEF
jgi:hypothetical protein